MTEQTTATARGQGQVQAIGRVKSPSFRISVQMSYRSVRNRLGRMVVTWLGIALGISFLMSALVTSGIREALRDVTERRATVESMFGSVRAEVGKLADKKVAIVTPTGGSDEVLGKLLERLRGNSPAPQIVGPLAAAKATSDVNAFAGASVLIAWNPEQWADVSAAPQWLKVMKQPVVLTHGSVDKLMPLAARGGRVRDILPSDKGEKERLAKEALDRKNRMNWLVGISLLVAAIGISNALLMSVTERFREIGTMKCLGSLDSFVIRLILLESGFLGGTGAVAGIALGCMFAIVGFSGTYGFSTVWGAVDGGSLAISCVGCLVVGWIVAVIAAVYPARVAAKMIPADALRTEI